MTTSEIVKEFLSILMLTIALIVSLPIMIPFCFFYPQARVDLKIYCGKMISRIDALMAEIDKKQEELNKDEGETK